MPNGDGRHATYSEMEEIVDGVRRDKENTARFIAEFPADGKQYKAGGVVVKSNLYP